MEAPVLEQSPVEVSNQLGWGAGGGGFLRGGLNSQHWFAHAPLFPRSCLQVSGLPSLAGKRMQILASWSSGMKMGPKDASSCLEASRPEQAADLSEKGPSRLVSRNQRGVSFASSWAVIVATKDTRVNASLIMMMGLDMAVSTEHSTRAPLANNHREVWPQTAQAAIYISWTRARALLGDSTRVFTGIYVSKRSKPLIL